MTGLRKRLLLVTRAIGVMLAIAALAGPARVTQTGRKALGIIVDASQSMGEEGLTKSLTEAARVRAGLGSEIDSFVVQLGAQPELLPVGSTPAMQAGITTKVWELADIADLLDVTERLAA